MITLKEEDSKGEVYSEGQMARGLYQWALEKITPYVNGIRNSRDLRAGEANADEALRIADRFSSVLRKISPSGDYDLLSSTLAGNIRTALATRRVSSRGEVA